MQLPFKHGFPTKTANSSTFGSPSKRAPFPRRIGSKRVSYRTRTNQQNTVTDRSVTLGTDRSSDLRSPKKPGPVRVEFLLRFFSLKEMEMDGCEKYGDGLKLLKVVVDRAYKAPNVDVFFVYKTHLPTPPKKRLLKIRFRDSIQTCSSFQVLTWNQMEAVCWKPFSQVMGAGHDLKNLEDFFWEKAAVEV